MCEASHDALQRFETVSERRSLFSVLAGRFVVKLKLVGGRRGAPEHGIASEHRTQKGSDPEHEPEPRTQKSERQVS